MAQNDTKSAAEVYSIFKQVFLADPKAPQFTEKKARFLQLCR
jgi:hypothetical protein